MILTIVIFILLLAILVFVHEAGHFIVAKRSGMKVDEFGFGFPPRLIGVYKSSGRWRIVLGAKQPERAESTIYSINWIVLGGFVKIVGENNEGEDDPQSFINKPFFARLFTLLAGVIMNVILAWVLISILYVVGLQAAVDDPASIPANAHFSGQQLAIIDVSANSPAAQAGLMPSDIIQSVDGQTFSSVKPLQDYIVAHEGQTVHVTVNRIGEVKQIDATPQMNPPAGTGALGVGLAIVGTLRYPWYEALWQGAQTTVSQLGVIISGLYHLIVSGVGWQSLGGPVKIAQLTGQVARLGFSHLVQFAAFLSLNLAILNTVPFPALDGGRVLFLIIEKIRGKRNNQTVEQWFNTVGFLALLLLMVIITVRDIIHLGH